MRKLLLLFVLLLVFVSWMGWTYRVRLVSETLTRNLGVPTYVTDVELSTHGIILRGLNMSGGVNGERSSALAVDSVRISFNPFNLLADPVHISEVSLDQVYVILDVSSWEILVKNWASLFERLSKKDQPVAESSSHEVHTDKRYIVDHVIVTNIYVSLDNQDVPTLARTRPVVAKLVLNDVGSQKPRSLSQTVRLILGAILEKASLEQPQLSGLADGLIKQADEEFKKVLQNIKEQYHESDKEGTWQKVRSFFDWKKKDK